MGALGRDSPGIGGVHREGTEEGAEANVSHFHSPRMWTPSTMRRITESSIFWISATWRAGKQMGRNLTPKFPDSACPPQGSSSGPTHSPCSTLNSSHLAFPSPAIPFLDTSFLPWPPVHLLLSYPISPEIWPLWWLPWPTTSGLPNSTAKT